MIGRVLLLGGAAVAGLVVVVVTGLASAVAAGRSTGVSTAGIADIPAPMLALYQRAAATCPGLDWAVLAAVGKVETDHGRSTLPGVAPGTVNSAGAGGYMQFLAPTFAEVVATHPPPPGGASPPSRYNAHDAVYSAAAYLCDSGARRTSARPDGDIRRALYQYNHSSAYVDDVLAQADRYRTTTPPPASPGSVGDSERGAVAVAYARSQLGLPYLWGGDGPAAGEAGFDCSGLTAAAWGAAGVAIPRTAQTQYRALIPVPRAQIQAGDLIFFGTPDNVHHVGIATGKGLTMIHAPQRGSTVRIADATTFPDLLSVGRPTRTTPNPNP